jgi:hypothetical protein
MSLYGPRIQPDINIRKVAIFLQKFAEIFVLLSLLDWVLHYGFDIISGSSVKVIIPKIFLLEIKFYSFWT